MKTPDEWLVLHNINALLLRSFLMIVTKVKPQVGHEGSVLKSTDIYGTLRKPHNYYNLCFVRIRVRTMGRHSQYMNAWLL